MQQFWSSWGTVLTPPFPVHSGGICVFWGFFKERFSSIRIGFPGYFSEQFFFNSVQPLSWKENGGLNFHMQPIVVNRIKGEPLVGASVVSFNCWCWLTRSAIRRWPGCAVSSQARLHQCPVSTDKMLSRTTQTSL